MMEYCQKDSTISRSYHKGLIDGGKNGAKFAQQRSHVSRSGLMRLRGDLNKVDIVITQMALENLQKRQVHLSHLGYLRYSVGCTTSH